ncbi:putative mitochondrial phosphate carrier protein [Phaeoacremonium minimum UCRPA7]|uniref:Putative mitochondrial phosphate carrier protein n=1 Tax=Phaeoacremonium minimum (strain UCR-PA7) TaxID=1286976 RepID=R8BWQ1_PHAM7|nr:putative mitochondrial phosphate carrier protein [Phaeoacremonium minimum UCRPA7]EOO03783.1 putative mitochondrial phosphate carrier protein [Phaeoacremonium minimum UCRPA7]
MGLITRTVTLTNFLIASSALGFQVFVLYPWHKDLDAGFDQLKKEHVRVLGAVGDGSGLIRDRKAVRSAKDSSQVKDAEPLRAASLYAKYAFAGAFCCSFTHAVLTPVDVVKTRIQLEPLKYDRGIFGTARQIVSTEGSSALLTGFGPTVVGYCLQGAFKFGGYEFFKQRAVDYLGYDTAAANRNAVYLASSAAAEFLGDIALCPFEATRIRLVSEPTFARNFVGAFTKIAKQEGFTGFYSGLSPIVLKQVPYTAATFLVYEKAIQVAYSIFDRSTLSSAGMTGINLGSGLVAGVAAAIVSHPADTVLSKINKEKGIPGESTLRRLVRIATGLGLRGSFTGLHARIVMVGGMTAVQFAIYGDIKRV